VAVASVLEDLPKVHGGRRLRDLAVLVGGEVSALSYAISTAISS
jgi:hypothetical protein